MVRKIEEIQQEIGSVQYDMRFIKQTLDDIKRRHDLAKDKIWMEYRRDVDDLGDKASEAREKMTYYENEIQWRKNRISQLESENQSYDSDYGRSGREIDKMRHDETPDNEQLYDFMQRRREAEEAERRKDQNQREMQRLNDEIEEFNRMYWSKESDLGTLEGRRPDLRQERRDKLYRAKIYYDEMSASARDNMRDRVRQLEDLQSELKLSYEYAHQENPKASTESEHFSDAYQQYLDDNFIASGEAIDNEEDYDSSGRSYGRHLEAEKDDEPEDEVEESNRQTVIKPKISQKLDDYFQPAQSALKEYSEQTGRAYHEQTERQGFTGSVGRTTYKYQDKSKIEVTRKEENKAPAIPSIEDFMTILSVEKNGGKTAVNVSKADSDEYRARLMIACQRVGIKTRGYTKIEDVNNLEDATCDAFKKMPDKDKNQDLLRRIETERKAKKTMPNAQNNLNPFMQQKRGSR